MTVDLVRPSAVFPLHRAKGAVADRSAAANRRATHDGIREHPARGRGPRANPDGQRLHTLRRFWRRAAKQAAEDDARLPQRRCRGADRHRRGLARLHIPDVSHVFKFDLPNDAEDYVHASGARRARGPRATPSASAASKTRSGCRTSSAHRASDSAPAIDRSTWPRSPRPPLAMARAGAQRTRSRPIRRGPRSGGGLVRRRRAIGAAAAAARGARSPRTAKPPRDSAGPRKGIPTARATAAEAHPAQGSAAAQGTRRRGPVGGAGGAAAAATPGGGAPALT